MSIFKTKERKLMMQMVYEYYDEFKTSPKENFYDLFKEAEESMSSDLYDRCMNLIGVIMNITGSNHEYILSRINDAIYHFDLEEASVNFASLVKNKKYDEAIGEILKTIRKPRAIEEPYYDFFKDTSYIQERVRDNRYKMLTNIKSLDSIIGGFRQKWLVTLLGATKSGKTWFLIEMAIQAVLQGLNVLFISLEMGKEQIDERFDMAVGFMASNPKGECEILHKINDTYVKQKDIRPSIYNIDEVVKQRRKFKRIGNGGIRIVAFNRGRLNYQDIDRIIDELEERDGFYIDVLITDYLGIMKATEPGQNKKQIIGENCLGLKEIAAMRNIISISAMQGNRRAMESRIFHSYLVADDIDTIFNSDLVLAICQTEIEEKNNQARMYIANYRHGRQHLQIGIYRDLEIGQFSIDEFEIKEKTGMEDQNLQAGVDF
jgi:replicative DNA helicase